jgi:hypothetical protein
MVEFWRLCNCHLVTSGMNFSMAYDSGQLRSLLEYFWKMNFQNYSNKLKNPKTE